MSRLIFTFTRTAAIILTSFFLFFLQLTHAGDVLKDDGVVLIKVGLK